MTATSLQTVLAVDDSLIIQALIKRSLSNNYRVLTANSATDALSLINCESVSILLLDVSMPGIDGLELCRTIRLLPQFQSLPIIMLTSRDGASDQVQGRLAGATQYLTKPFNTNELNQVIHQLIS